jgi:transposase
MTAGEVSDYTGAAALLGHMPTAEWLLADRGCNADWYREALKDTGIRVNIPGRKSRKKIRFDRRRYKRRNRIEIMFSRLKDWLGLLPATTESQGAPLQHYPRSRHALLAVRGNESGA